MKLYRSRNLNISHMKFNNRLSILTCIAVVLIAFTSCKGESGHDKEGEGQEIIADSISPTGSDGLGREVDTVQQIKTQNDSVNADKGQ